MKLALPAILDHKVRKGTRVTPDLKASRVIRVTPGQLVRPAQ